MYNWNSIRNVRRLAYLILVTNIGLGLFLINSKSKNTRHHQHTNGKVGYIHAKRGVKLRQQADANSNYILNIGDGEPVSVVNDTATMNKGWVMIKYKNKIGWVWGDYLGK